MKLGTCHLWGSDLEAFRSEVRLASELGYDLITVGDSPAGWHDLFVSLVVASQEAPRATLAPLVTSPFLRHPIATANALGSLYDLAGGRVALGLATGGSTVMAIGRMPATQDEMRAEIGALRALLAGGETTWNGAPVKALRYAQRVPIYYSAFGPKALAFAGEQADGVILFAGSGSLDALRGKIAAVRAAARAAGRDPTAIDIWVISYTSIRESRTAAIDDLKAFIAVNGMALRTPEAIAAVPDLHRSALIEFQRRYDPSEHVVVGGRNVARMEELGLLDFLAGFDTTAGTVDEVAGTLRAIAAMGVSTFIVPLPGHADPHAVLRGLRAVKDAL